MVLAIFRDIATDMNRLMPRAASVAVIRRDRRRSAAAVMTAAVMVSDAMPPAGMDVVRVAIDHRSRSALAAARQKGVT